MQTIYISWRWVGLGAAACAACCAPLIAPLVASIVGGGLFAGAGAIGRMSWDTIFCGAIAAGAAGYVGSTLLRPRRSRQAVKPCECATACDLQSCSGNLPAR